MCNREAPGVAQVARDYDGDVEIMGVAGRDTDAAITDFVERHELGHVRHAIDHEEQVWQAFGILGQPAWVFVDGTTGESSVTFGALTEEQLLARLEELSEPGGP